MRKMGWFPQEKSTGGWRQILRLKTRCGWQGLPVWSGSRWVSICFCPMATRLWNMHFKRPTLRGCCFCRGEIGSAPVELEFEIKIVFANVLFYSFYYFNCSEGSNLTPAHHYPDFRFKTYAPLAFRYFRELFGIKPDDYLVRIYNFPFFSRNVWCKHLSHSNSDKWLVSLIKLWSVVKSSNSHDYTFSFRACDLIAAFNWWLQNLPSWLILK